MVDTLLIAFIFGGLGLLIYFWRCWKYSKLPPGPKGLPFVGNAFQQDPERPYLMWSKWVQNHGNVFTIWNFGKPMVLCTGYDAMWEMLVTKSNDFAGRPQQYISSCCTDNHNDVGHADFNPGWAHRKKVFMTGLKMYGEGIKRLEDLMVDIIAELEEDIKDTKQHPFDPQKYFELALANTLSLLLTGNKFERNEPDFLLLVEYANQSRKLFSQSLQTFAYDAFPLLHYLPLPHSKLIDQYVNGFMKDWMPRQIEKAEVYYDKDNCACMMDALFKQKDIDEKTGAEHPLEDHHIVGIGEDFFLGGLNTSTSTLYTLFAVLTAKPEIQEKAREEVDRVLQGRQPTLKDRQSMPYIQAMLEEVLRYAVLIPGFPHKATTDSTLCGHFIPKGTEIMPNNWFLCHDLTFWNEPNIFKPERFLDKYGDFLPADHPTRKHVLVFGAGRRICPGEQLARNRVFLITTSLLQKFIFKPVADDQLPLHDPETFKLGVAIMPHPYQLWAIPRE